MQQCSLQAGTQVFLVIQNGFMQEIEPLSKDSSDQNQNNWWLRIQTSHFTKELYHEVFALSSQGEWVHFQWLIAIYRDLVHMLFQTQELLLEKLVYQLAGLINLLFPLCSCYSTEIRYMLTDSFQVSVFQTIKRWSIKTTPGQTLNAHIQVTGQTSRLASLSTPVACNWSLAGAFQACLDIINKPFSTKNKESIGNKHLCHRVRPTLAFPIAELHTFVQGLIAPEVMLTRGK